MQQAASATKSVNLSCAHGSTRFFLCSVFLFEHWFHHFSFIIFELLSYYFFLIMFLYKSFLLFTVVNLSLFITHLVNQFFIYFPLKNFFWPLHLIYWKQSVFSWSLSTSLLYICFLLSLSPFSPLEPNC